MSQSSNQEINSFEFNRKKIESLLRKYPDRYPIIVSSKSIKCGNVKYISTNMTIAEFMIILRKKINLSQNEGLFFFIKDKNKSDIMVQPSSNIEILYNTYKDENLVLNLIFEKEAVFG
jgi:hypothetical protein